MVVCLTENIMSPFSAQRQQSTGPSAVRKHACPSTLSLSTVALKMTASKLIAITSCLEIQFGIGVDKFVVLFR